MSSIKYKTEDGYISVPLNIIGSRVYLEDYDDGEVIPELVDDNAKLGIGIGTCSTSSGNELEVTLSGYKLVKNGMIAVTFENDVPAGATLNVNGKGAKPIYNEGSSITADTIKAGKTVMFCYDGTNYVVTSLGGGSAVFPEFVTIQLTQTGGSDSALIGATVVVTNDDTSATILSTTWYGSGIFLQVAAGVDYTVTVGNVSSLVIKTNTQSYTAESGLSRIIEFTYFGNAVDMGLPSGTKWAKGNIVKSGYNYIIGEETEYGGFASWGNKALHFSSNGSSFDDGYSFSNSAYNSSPGAALTASFAANSGYDAARENIGSPWRLPTTAEFKELYDNCTSVITTKNGIKGEEFTSKINGAKIFLPASGRGVNNGVLDRGTLLVYWTSSLYNTTNGYCYFNNISVTYE